MTDGLLIPLSAIEDQVFNLQIQDQNLKFHLCQRNYGLYLDLWINDILTLAGRLCLNRTFLLQDATLPLLGDFMFVDAQGEEDPDYTGLGSRFQLYFI